MNERAEQLRKQVAEYFADATAFNSAAAVDNLPDEMPPKTKAVFDSVVDNTVGAIRDLFEGSAVKFLESYYTDLRTILSYHPVATYEAWHLAEYLAEDDFLACEKAIESRDLSGLESLRDQKRTKEISYPLYGMYVDYLNLFIKVRFLFVVFAHLAKKLGARSAALKFLESASKLANCIKSRIPYLNDVYVEEIVSSLQEGIHEFSIVADYNAMDDWDAFVAREKSNFEAMENRE